MKEFLEKLKNDIEFNGSKSYQLFSLIKKMYPKAKAVSDNRIKELKEVLVESSGFYTFPDLVQGLTRNTNILITDKEYRRSTAIFPSESEFQQMIVHQNLLSEIFRIEGVLDQHKLRGANGIVDFIGVKNKQITIIEIKKDSSYYGIEQLLRYNGILKQNKELSNIIKENKWYADFKMILITAIEDPKLHFVFNGMVKEQRKHFQWFIYDYDGKDKLEFIEIEIN